MDWITTYASETQLQQTVNALAQCNDRTARFGLSLTARELAGGDAAFLADVPPEALRRIAAGGSLRGTGLERGDG